MNKDQKAAVVDEVAEAIQAADAVFAVDYRGISVTQAAELRTRLIEADASLRVVKNTLTERAADKAGAESLKELLEGPTALTFVKGDVAMAAKAIATFRRENELPQWKGGTMGGDPITVEQIESIAKLPAREVLNAQLAGTIASPLTGLVRGLNSLISGIAVALGQIAEQGLVSGEPPAPDEPVDSGQSTVDSGEAPAEEAEAPAEEATPAEEAKEAAEGTPAEPQATPDEQPPEASAEEETPSEAPGDPVAEAEAAEEETSEETPSEGDTEEQEG